MNYYFTQNKLIAYNNNVVEETIIDYNFENPFCLDESSYKLFQALNKKNVKLENGVLVVGRSKLKLLNSKPPLFSKEFNSCFKLNINKLKEASKFVSKSDERPSLTGVFISDNGSILATDSFKIYCYREENSDIKNGVTITSDLVKELCKYNGEECDMYFNNQVASVKVNENTTITGRLINGNYPILNSLLAFGNKEPLIFDQDKLGDIIKLGDLLKGESRKIVFNNNTVTITDFENLGDEIVEELETNLEELLCLSFENLKIIMNVLGKNCSVYIENSKKPITFTNENDDTLCIVMPMIH